MVERVVSKRPPDLSGETIQESLNKTLDRVKKALTDPSVLNNPSSFADKIAEFKVDFNILESIQQTMLKGRELSVGGTERDREAVGSFMGRIAEDNERQEETVKKLISQFEGLEAALKKDNEAEIKSASEKVRERCEDLLENDASLREKLALDRVAEFIERLEESEKKKSLTEGLLEESRIAAGGMGSLGGAVERGWTEKEEREEKRRREEQEKEEKERKDEKTAEAVKVIEEEFKRIKKGLLQEIEKLRRRWDDYLKARKRAELEKDLSKKKKAEEDLDRQYAKLKKETKERVRKLYEELYVKKLKILQEAQEKLAQLIREGAGKEKREREILAIVKKDAELYDALSSMLRQVRSTRELGVFIQRLIYSILRDPIKRMLEKLILHLDREKADDEEIHRLLTLISKFSKIRPLLKKLSNQLTSGASRGGIEKTLKEISENMPLNQLEEDLKDLLAVNDDLNFRKRSVLFLRKLEENLSMNDALGRALRTRDPATIAETERLLRQIYGELIPGIGGEMAVAQLAGRYSREDLSKMIQKRITDFKDQSGI